MEWSHSLYFKYHKPLLKFFIRLDITPNQITIFNMFLMLIGAGWFFSRGLWWANWLALTIITINVILDYVDGDLARERNMLSKSGIFLDSCGDVILQNGIMGAIALGNYKLGLPVFYIVIYFVANITLNMVSFHYNNTFGFDSYKGNELFRQYMNQKPSLINRLFKNIIDPTSSKIGIFLYTVRYWIVLGVIFNQMILVFLFIILITIFRSLFMYIVYILHLLEYKKLWLLQALAIMDNEREEFYKCRMK